jgi:membrane protease YdiL (CAAX protease family)
MGVVMENDLAQTGVNSVKALSHLITERSARWALIYLAAITVSEVLTTLIRPEVGLILHSLVLIALLAHAAAVWGKPMHKLWLALTLAPLIRLLSLSLPLAGFPLIYWYLIISVPLFVAAGLIAYTLRLSAREIGLRLPGRRQLLAQLAVASTGLVFGYVEYQILKPAPLAPALTLEQVWLPMLILLVSTGFAEELIFRGILQRAAEHVVGRFNVLYVSILFAVLHVGYKSLVDVLFVLVVALYFGWVTTRTRSLLGVTLAHGLTNIMLFLVVPLWPH